jgi:hypothetical protein
MSGMYCGKRIAGCVVNHHLEQIAQAIFKSWFVNFEPFKDIDFINSELV